MNYIKLVNWFWETRRQRNDYDPYVIALFFALVDIANRREWKPFTAYRDDVLTLAGMSAKPYYKARQTLKDSGLISFTEGSSKRTMCRFEISQPFLTVTEAPTVATTVGHTVPPTVAPTVATTILNKHVNNKLINSKQKEERAPLITVENEVLNISSESEKPKEKSSAKKEKVAEPEYHPLLLFHTPEFKESFNEFLAFRRQIKHAIVEASYKEFFSKLKRLSNSKETVAIAILKQSIANGWRGIFELKADSPYYTNGTTPDNYRQNQQPGSPDRKPSAAELAYAIAS